MKAFVIALTLAYASLIGCVNAQQKAIKGSGNIVTEERNVALFDKIKASRSIHVFLTQGENRGQHIHLYRNECFKSFITSHPTGGY